MGAKRLGGETSSRAKPRGETTSGGGVGRPGGKRLGGETTWGGNGLGAKEKINPFDDAGFSERPFFGLASLEICANRAI